MSASPQPQYEQYGGAGHETQALLYDQIFGGGDNGIASDVSDSEDEGPRRAKPRSASPAAEQQENGVDEEDKEEDRDQGAVDREKGKDANGDKDADEVKEEDNEDNEEDREDEQDHDKEDNEDNDSESDDDKDEDVYVPGTATSSAKIPKFKKKAAGDEDNDEEDRDEDEGEAAARRRKKHKKEKKRRRERSAPAEEDEEEQERILNPEEQRRLELEERIENIGKKTKVTRRKKKGDDDVDIVDSYHDDVCARLRERMLSAAERDRIANDAKSPATAKLAMLGEVMAVLRNQTLWQSINDNGVLEAVRQWLEPSSSGALPAVGIQKAIFEILPKMDLDTTTLKECRLGPIVLFYTKTKRVTPEINRQADALVQAWSRPIIKRPANFRSRHIESAAEAISNTERIDDEMDLDDDAPRPQPAPAPRRKRFDARAALDDNKGRKGARLYLGKETQYTVAPESQLHHNHEDLSHVSRIQMDNKKFNKFARQLKSRTR